MTYDLAFGEHGTLPNCLRVLIVEDSVDDAALLVRELGRGGYQVTFEQVETPEGLHTALATQSWDLMITDYTMPRFSGLGALKLLKQTGIDIPFIMVSGSIGEETAVEVMKAGAHDYLMKDNLRRLVPSVDREMREAKLRRRRRLIEEENQRNSQRIRALHEIELAVTSTLDLHAILNILLEKIDCLLPGSAVTVRLIDKKTGELVPVASRNIDEKPWRENGRKRPERLSKIILESSIPLTVANLQTDPRSQHSAFAARERLISYLGIPLIAKNETLGMIAFYFRELHRFNDDEIEFLTTLASQAAVAIWKAELYEESQRHLDRIRALHEIDVAITSSLDLRNRLTVLLEKIEIFVPIAAASSVRLFNPETRNLESLACRGLDEEKWRSLAGTTLRGRAKQVVTTKAPVIIRDIGNDERTYNAEIFRGLISYLGVPLMAHGQVLGVLTLYTAKEHEFTEEEIEFFTTLAGQAAIAIDNAELYEQTKRQANQLKERERVQRILKELSQDITAMEVDKLLEKLTATIRELFKADIADVRFLGNERWEQILVCTAEKTEWLPEGVEFGEGANLWVVKQRRSIAIRDYSQPGEFKPGRVSRRFAIRGFLAAPLIGRQGEVLGVVRALTKEARDFTSQEIDLFEQMANGAAIAIENSRLYGELQISNKVKSEFLGVMSHELRTPLNVITGYSNLLKQNLAAHGDVDGQSALRKIESQAEILLRMITTIMEATMIESGRSTFTKQRLDICTLVDQLKYENDLLKDNEVTLAWHITESLPVLHTDGQKLQSILQHLIDNAIKFTERGTVTISVRTTERHIEFCVTDTGVGIPAENLRSIFEIFKQGDSSDTRSFEGVGLGLYIANKYAELLGSSINVKSKVGEGSTFTLAVPLTV
jgi:GAF domain-containing protein/DNA-binding NarL/FixJ family response regulator/anti-sigma regulatory factor (Ser/Thr protein kinase)